MGTKHDDACLAKVADDEPIFVLRAQDVLASTVVRYWALLARDAGTPEAKIEEALAQAKAMGLWHTQKAPD